jgi:hypothetical protein
VAESRYLDYKERLPGDSDEDKRELLADVTAFANTAGGDLLYGVRERREENRATGEPEAIVGLPGVNLDQATLRLDNVLRDGMEPRIPGLTFHVVARDPDPPCLIIRVPKSPLGLHMVTYKGLSRFHGRGASGRFVLDWGQIRAGFLEAQTAQERLKRFRLERVTRQLAGETPIPTGDGPKIIFHALPLNPSDVLATFLTLSIEQHVIDVMRPLSGTPRSWRFNLEGFVVHTLRDDLGRQTYSQCFRDGGIEAMGPLELETGRAGYRAFYGFPLETTVINALTRYQHLWRLLGVASPMMLALTLSGVLGTQIRTSLGASSLHEETFDHDVALIPELVVQDPGAPAARLLQPLFDLMWNAAGWPRSPWYTPTGERIEPR